MFTPASEPDQKPARFGGGGSVKLALTVRACVIVTEQVAAVPLHEPPQPAKVLPPVAAAVSVTGVPSRSVWVQSPLSDLAESPHAIPEPVIVPVPVLADPATIVRAYLGGGEKPASTVMF
jgi:hypothetical protein